MTHRLGRMVAAGLFAFTLPAVAQTPPATPPPPPAATMPPPAPAQPLGPITRFPGDGTGAYKTHRYRNLFAERLGKSPAETKAKIDTAFRQLFHGDGQEQRLRRYGVGVETHFPTADPLFLRTRRQLRVSASPRLRVKQPSHLRDRRFAPQPVCGGS